MTDGQSPDTALDVAIFGGGVAGAYCAYRLKKQFAEKNVQLFELSNRIGGRLWSHKVEGMEKPLDIGGMYFYESHQNVFGLCKHLQLETSQDTIFDAFRFYYLRRHHFTNENFKKPKEGRKTHYPDVIPYFVEETEKFKAPADLILEAFNKFADGATKLLIEIGESAVNKSRYGITPSLSKIKKFHEFLTKVTVQKGNTKVGLEDSGFWNALEESYSTEALKLMLDAIGLSSIFGNRNLLETIFEFSTDIMGLPPIYLPGGYDSVPKTMVQEFEKDNGMVHLRTRLRRLDRMTSSDNKEIVAATVAFPDGVRVIYAQNVILAMPQRAIELLDPESCIFSDKQFTENLSTVTAQPACKLFLVYKEPWWLKAGKKLKVQGKQMNLDLSSGRSTTDLPLRTTFYFPPTSGQPAFLMASLADYNTAEFWSGFKRSARFGPKHAAFGDPTAPIALSVPLPMIEEAQRQLMELHGVTNIPDPIDGAFFNWESDPFGGGWHFWNPHVDSGQVIPSIRRPLPDSRIFLCGEAFSFTQGWVEGAINSAEMVLETFFKVPPPDWVPPDYQFETVSKRKPARHIR